MKGFRVLGEQLFTLGLPNRLRLGNRVTAGGDTTAPTAPTGLTATPVSTSQINLAWTDASDDEAGFRVYRSTDGVNYSQIGSDLAAGTQAYNDASVTGGTKYWYKIGVFDSSQNEALTSAVTANTLTLSLVAYWTLDEASDGSAPVTRNDSVGTSHLTDLNTCPSAAAKVSNGVDVTAASSESLSVTDNAAVSIGDVDCTFSVWVRFDALVNNYGVLGKWGANNEYAIAYLTAPSAHFTFTVQNSSGVQDAADTTAITPAINTWYHFICYHDKTNDIIGIQVNNAAADTKAHAGGIRDGTNDFRIGQYSNAATYMDGKIDEVGIWKRLLSADEKTSLYNGGAGKTYPF